MMDEHAGPGVFLSGGGSGSAPHLGSVSGGEAARARYSVPGILHFLQHEWARFEVERAHWEVERAKLQAQVAFLQGERRGQENLKKDLVRRIKMLEFVLKQERAKHHRLKFGTELNQGEMDPPSYDSDEGNDSEASSPANSSHQLSWRQGRQLLRQYLQEVGYSDAILDVKSQRVRALLGLTGDPGDQPADGMVNGTEPSSPKDSKPDLPDPAIMLEAFKFIENAVAEFSDEEEDEEARDKTVMDLAAMRRKPSSTSSSSSSSASSSSTTSDFSDDPDTEEALKGFDFLTSPDEMDGPPEFRGGKDGGEWEEERRPGGELGWDVDQGLIAQLKEQYRKERRGKKGVKRPNRSKLQDMLANLRDAEELPPMQAAVTPPLRPSVPRISEPDAARPEDEPMAFLPATGKSFLLGGEDEAVSGELGLGELGELAGLTVANEAESPSYEVSDAEGAGLKARRLRDAAAARPSPGVQQQRRPEEDLEPEVHPAEPLRLGPRPGLPPGGTGSGHGVRGSHAEAVEPAEDGAGQEVSPAGLCVPARREALTSCLLASPPGVPLWTWSPSTPSGLTGETSACQLQQAPPPPCRRATPTVGAVLCVTMSASGEQCFSGGVDGTIQSWNTPNPNIDPYDSYEPSVLRGALSGHTDSVWGVVYSAAHHRLLSCSADGTVRLWNAADTAPCLAVFNEGGELGAPTSVDLVSSDPAYMVASFSSGHMGLFNMETQQLVLKLESAGAPEAPCKINKVLSHPALPISITAQEDRHIRFFDNNTGKLIHSMVAHLDSVTCLAVDPNGLYLMSGSHDCSIRLWNMETRTCIQEFTAHRKKFEESIHDVAFHPTKCYISSAGADALAKVFV